MKICVNCGREFTPLNPVRTKCFGKCYSPEEEAAMAEEKQKRENPTEAEIQETAKELIKNIRRQLGR